MVAAFSPGCPDCCEEETNECAPCVDGETPPQIQVDLDGAADGLCDECATINGAWIFDQDEGDTCLWNGEITVPCDEEFSYPAIIEIWEESGHTFVSLTIDLLVESQLILIYRKESSTTIDCETFDGLEFFSRDVTGIYTDCDLDALVASFTGLFP